MATTDHSVSLEEQIDQWRNYLRRRQAIHSVDIVELEDHLREQVAGLVDSGLAADEAFLVAVKRIGDLDALSREFAREHSDRLWKQLSWALRFRRAASDEPNGCHRRFCLAVAAARGRSSCRRSSGIIGRPTPDSMPQSEFLRAAALTATSFGSGGSTSAVPLARRGVRRGGRLRQYLSVPRPDGYTEALTALHLPIALWLVVGIAYAAGRWRPSCRPHGLHSILRRAVHLLRADRARRRRPTAVSWR
jgi:hypothetical protein